MDSDASGWLWLVIDVLMVAVLGIALVYGTMLWRQRRSRAREQVSERNADAKYQPTAKAIPVIIGHQKAARAAAGSHSKPRTPAASQQSVKA